MCFFDGLCLFQVRLQYSLLEYLCVRMTNIPLVFQLFFVFAPHDGGKLLLIFKLASVFIDRPLQKAIPFLDSEHLLAQLSCLCFQLDLGAAS